MKLSELRGRVLGDLGEDGRGFITDSDVDAWLNAAALDVAERSECLRGSETTTTTASTQAYALASDVIRLELVTYDGDKLSPASLMEAVSSTDTGTPARYALWGGDIYLSPIPDAAKTLAVYHVANPTAMVSETDTSGLPREAENLLVLFARARAMEKDEKNPALLWQQYFAGIEALKRNHSGVRRKLGWTF